MSAINDVVLVLVGTDGSENAGSVARLAGNFGCALRFVDVHADLACKGAYKMAHPMETFLDGAPRFTSLTDAVADCVLRVGTTGKIVRPGGVPVLDLDVARAMARGDGERVALVFGNERTGLSLADATCCEQLVRLPAPGPAQSFNLASAVAVTLTLFHSAWSQTTMASSSAAASSSERAALTETFEALLVQRGFYRGASPAGFRPRLEELVHKMAFSPRDARLMAELLTALSTTKTTTTKPTEAPAPTAAPTDTPDDPTGG
jgi:tRNA C32,U32 (ribose-2'-O)-methylase TrmJ